MNTKGEVYSVTHDPHLWICAPLLSGKGENKHLRFGTKVDWGKC